MALLNMMQAKGCLGAATRAWVQVMQSMKCLGHALMLPDLASLDSVEVAGQSHEGCMMLAWSAATPFL